MLTARGVDRKEAYEAVQRAAMRTWKEGGNFADDLAAEPTVARYLSEEEIAQACSPERHFRHIADKFEAVGIVG